MGRPQAARMPITGDFVQSNQVYGLDPLDNLERFISELYAHAQAQGLPVETMISEYAPGQYELTLRYRESGLRANFMAKPFANRSGSGMHLHTSLMDAAGGT